MAFSIKDLQSSRMILPDGWFSYHCSPLDSSSFPPIRHAWHHSWPWSTSYFHFMTSHHFWPTRTTLCWQLTGHTKRTSSRQISLNWNHDFMSVTIYHFSFQTGSEVDQRLYREKMRTVRTFSSAMNSLITEPHIAMYFAKDSILLALEQGKMVCDYEIVSSFSTPTWISVYAQKNWPYRELFNFQ